MNKWDAKNYKDHASFVSTLAMDLVEVLNPKEGEDILDLGCGDGTLSLEIKKSKANVIAVDLSSNMIKKAISKGIEAYKMDATNIKYINKFDAIFSNAVLHWVRDKQKAVQNINKALKVNGRFVAEFGGEGNLTFVVKAMKEVFLKNKDFGEFKNPWYFPNPKEYKELLEQNGFEVLSIKLTNRPTQIDDISNWLEIFANGIISHLSKDNQVKFAKEVKDILLDKLYDKENNCFVDYVRIRVEAVKIS